MINRNLLKFNILGFSIMANSNMMLMENPNQMLQVLPNSSYQNTPMQNAPMQNTPMQNAGYKSPFGNEYNMENIQLTEAEKKKDSLNSYIKFLCGVWSTVGLILIIVALIFILCMIGGFGSASGSRSASGSENYHR
jgi:hypothetical protein